MFGNLNFWLGYIRIRDLKDGQGLLILEDISIRSRAIFELWSLLRTKNSLLFQRSCSMWLKEGDENIGFFNAFIKSRKMRSSVLPLQVGEACVEGVIEIQHEVTKYFINHFHEPFLGRPQLDDVSFWSLSYADVEMLSSHFLWSEIDMVVSLYEGNKSLSLYNFDSFFLRRFTCLLKEDFGLLF